MCCLFFYEKDSSVYTKVDSTGVTERKTKYHKMVEFDKIIFLCNENTASAAEAMIFNMKSDFNEKIQVVGGKTYGKNFCYSLVEYEDGEVFMFVSGIMANAEGITFGENGIEPDYSIEDEKCLDVAIDLLQ